MPHWTRARKNADDTGSEWQIQSRHSQLPTDVCNMHTFRDVLLLHRRKRWRDGRTKLDENAMMAATATAQGHGLTVVTLLVTGFQARGIGPIR